MLLEKMLKSHQGRVIISIIWGFGLACLFRKVCTGRNCIVYKAPNPNEMMNNIYQHDSKCYKYKTMTTSCTKDAITNY